MSTRAGGRVNILISCTASSSCISTSCLLSVLRVNFNIYFLLLFWLCLASFLVAAAAGLGWIHHRSRQVGGAVIEGFLGTAVSVQMNGEGKMDTQVVASGRGSRLPLWKKTKKERAACLNFGGVLSYTMQMVSLKLRLPSFFFLRASISYFRTRKIKERREKSNRNNNNKKRAAMYHAQRECHLFLLARVG